MAYRVCALAASRASISFLAARGARSYAAASHAPPLNLYGIPARYANATYTAASKANKLDEVELDLMAFAALLQKNSDFAKHLSNPTLQRGAKVALMENIFASKKTNEISKNLFMTMAANSRLADVSKVIDNYLLLMKEKRGIVDVTVTTAEALTPEQQKALMKALGSRVGQGKEPRMNMQVDASILGGLKVQIGDQFMDLSAGTKVNELAGKLLQD